MNDNANGQVAQVPCAPANDHDEAALWVPRSASPPSRDSRTSPSTAKSCERRPVDRLHENPHQRDLFDDLSDAEVTELAADMQAHGQRNPIEILPAGTVIDGHQRLRAAKKLGWTEVEVRVRHDLAAAKDEAVEQYMIEVNLHRRQMGVLAIARLYKRLKQIERGLGRSGLSSQGQQELRDRLAERLGSKSGRTLDRYVKLLDTPREIQDAVSRGELPMGHAMKVLHLPRAVQQAVAVQVREGHSAKEAILAYLPSKPAGRTKARPACPSYSSESTTGTHTSQEERSIKGDLGELQGPLDALDDIIFDVVEAPLPIARKIVVMGQATALFQMLLNEVDA